MMRNEVTEGGEEEMGGEGEKRTTNIQGNGEKNTRTKRKTKLQSRDKSDKMCIDKTGGAAAAITLIWRPRLRCA